MSTTRRIIIAIIILVAAVGAILIIQSSRRGGYLYRACSTGQKEFSEGCVSVSSCGTAPAKFCQKDSAGLVKMSFRDKTEKKLQEGWLLRDVILLYVKKEKMAPETVVQVASSARSKMAELKWKDISDEQNKIILAVSKQGNLKLVSMMKDLDTREKWVQDVDRIGVLLK